MTLCPRFRADLRRLHGDRPGSLLRTFLEAILFDSGFQALVAHRMAHACRRRGVPVLPAALRRWAIGSCGVDILPRADIGGGCVIAHGLGIVIGGTAVIGEDCTLLQGVTLGEARFTELACPRVGNGVTIGARATLLGGIEVGDGAFVAAGAVVVDDVPPGCMAVGAPAQCRPIDPGRAPA